MKNLVGTLRIARKIFNSIFSRRMNIVTAEIALTYRCNLRCRYCDLSVFEKNGIEPEMSAEQLAEVFTKLECLGVERVNISGGEPLLRNDIAEILETAYTKKFQVNLTTNGIFVPKYIDLLRGLDCLIISIDGTKDTHDFSRGEGMHEEALRALKLSRQKGINVIVSAVLTKKTQEEDLLFLLQLSEDLGVYCILQPMTCGVYVNNKWIPFNSADKLMPSGDQLEALYQCIKSDPRKAKVIGERYYLEEVIVWYKRQGNISNKPIRCMAGKLFLCITPGGKMLPCSMRYEQMCEKNIWESSVKDIRRLNVRSLECEGCSCYAYMVLNGLRSMKIKAAMHCISSVLRRNGFKK